MMIINDTKTMVLGKTKYRKSLLIQKTKQICPYCRTVLKFSNDHAHVKAPNEKY